MNADGITLAIDAATAIGTVAVFRDGQLIGQGETRLKGEAGERLLPLIDETLALAGSSVAKVARVVCGAGPGSFTSLRIAASAAKGMAMARDIPLLAMRSLELMIAGAQPALNAGSYLAALDAMRGEYFSALVAIDGGNVSGEESFSLLSRQALEERAKAIGAEIVGPGFSRDVIPHARGAVAIDRWFAVDIDTWEPNYGRLAEAQVKWEAQHGRPLV